MQIIYNNKMHPPNSIINFIKHDFNSSRFLIPQRIHGSNSPNILTVALKSDANMKSIYIFKRTNRSDVNKIGSLPFKSSIIK